MQLCLELGLEAVEPHNPLPHGRQTVGTEGLGGDLGDGLGNRVGRDHLQQQADHFSISQCEATTQPSQRKSLGQGARDHQVRIILDQARHAHLRAELDVGFVNHHDLFAGGRVEDGEQ